VRDVSVQLGEAPVVALQLSVAGMSYVGLAANVSLMSTFEDAMTHVIAGSFGVPGDRVALVVSPGSIVVQANVTLYAGTIFKDTAELRTSLAQATLVEVQKAAFEELRIGSSPQIAATLDWLLEANAGLVSPTPARSSPTPSPRPGYEDAAEEDEDVQLVGVFVAIGCIGLCFLVACMFSIYWWRVKTKATVDLTELPHNSVDNFVLQPEETWCL